MRSSAPDRLVPIVAIALVAVLLLVPLPGCVPRAEALRPRPNILLIVADDLSWAHVGAYGDGLARTPALDRLAREGVRFDRAFAPSPSCTPTRGAILSGQEIWRLGPGAIMEGTLPAAIPIYPDLLEAAGYLVGHTGKGWGPGHPVPGGRFRNPAGPAYNAVRGGDAEEENEVDYAANLRQFLHQRAKGQPFCFWVGLRAPHLPWSAGAGARHGIDPAALAVPPFLPDTPGIRRSLSDYYGEVARADEQIAAVLSALQAAGDLEETLVIVTSDNGISVPRGKGNLYEMGTRVPLLVRWGSGGVAGRTVGALVSLTDLAPTLLEAAGEPVPESMTGRSLLGHLAVGLPPPAARPFVVTGREVHDQAYPSRAIRTDDYLYILNAEPGAWPHHDLDVRRPLPAEEFPGSLQEAPAAELLLRHHDQPSLQPYVQLCLGKRPREELFRLQTDPFQMTNLADAPEYAAVKEELARQLHDYLRDTADPRELGEPLLFATYPRYGRQWRARNPELLREWNRQMRQHSEHAPAEGDD